MSVHCQKSVPILICQDVKLQPANNNFKVGVCSRCQGLTVKAADEGSTLVISGHLVWQAPFVVPHVQVTPEGVQLLGIDERYVVTDRRVVQRLGSTWQNTPTRLYICQLTDRLHLLHSKYWCKTRFCTDLYSNTKL